MIMFPTTVGGPRRLLLGVVYGLLLLLLRLLQPCCCCCCCCGCCCCYCFPVVFDVVLLLLLLLFLFGLLIDLWLIDKEWIESYYCPAKLFLTFPAFATPPGSFMRNGWYIPESLLMTYISYVYGVAIGPMAREKKARYVFLSNWNGSFMISMVKYLLWSLATSCTIMYRGEGHPKMSLVKHESLPFSR